MASLAALGLVFRNMRAVWASAVIWLRRIKGGFRMVGDFRVADQQVEKVTGVMPNQDTSTAKLSGAR